MALRVMWGGGGALHYAVVLQGKKGGRVKNG